MSDQSDLLPGTLDLLILQTLAQEQNHGWAIAHRIQQVSHDLLKVQQGSLYPALYRMLRRGWLRAEWGKSENNRRAKFYQLRRAGKRQLGKETAEWSSFAAAVRKILGSG